MAFLAMDRPNPRWVNAIQKYRSLIIPLAFVSLLGVLLVPLPPDPGAEVRRGGEATHGLRHRSHR